MTDRGLAGLGALTLAAAYLLGIVGVLGPLSTLGLGTPDMNPSAVLALAHHTPWLLPLFFTVIYDLSALGTGLAAIALARSHSRDLPFLAIASAAVALIWAGLAMASGMVARAGLADLVALGYTDPERALETWRLMHLLETGLAGRTEALGGLWIGLVSFAAMRTGSLSGVVNLIGALVAAAGLVTYIPALADLGGMVFGLGAILWCLWVGVELLLPTPA
ncbi:MAG: hypothetical protein AAGF71_02695 [Pseudomonadota bacterium]